ncbi:DUF3034 family protein [Halomonas sp. BC1]|uniref:DUF3034 family protein n=1 Tax=Halomonas sp. BC1 TaxID=1670448 RepID=UPI0009C0B8C4|nr:DUF3034 family protein [Halomonas sp. BC1]
MGTGAVTAIEGAAGGGLSPWAVLASTASDDEVGVTAAVTRAWPTKRIGKASIAPTSSTSTFP